MKGITNAVSSYVASRGTMAVLRHALIIGYAVTILIFLLPGKNPAALASTLTAMLIWLLSSRTRFAALAHEAALPLLTLLLFPGLLFSRQVLGLAVMVLVLLTVWDIDGLYLLFFSGDRRYQHESGRLAILVAPVLRLILSLLIVAGGQFLSGILRFRLPYWWIWAMVLAAVLFIRRFVKN